jgi:hypothetical protein
LTAAQKYAGVPGLGSDGLVEQDTVEIRSAIALPNAIPFLMAPPVNG